MLTRKGSRLDKVCYPLPGQKVELDRWLGPANDCTNLGRAPTCNADNSSRVGKAFGSREGDFGGCKSHTSVQGFFHSLLREKEKSAENNLFIPLLTFFLMKYSEYFLIKRKVPFVNLF